MKRTIAIVLVVIAVVAFSGSMISQNRTPAPKPQKAVDPVCGLTVDKNPDLSSSYKGETYYFCSKADLEKFKKTPDRWAKKPASSR